MPKPEVSDRVKRFARALRVARMLADMSQQELANAIGVAPTTISGYETLQRTDTPQPNMVYKMEDALGIRDGSLALAAGYLPRREESEEAADEPPTRPPTAIERTLGDALSSPEASSLRRSPHRLYGDEEGYRVLVIPKEISDQVSYALQYLVNAIRHDAITARRENEHKETE